MTSSCTRSPAAPRWHRSSLRPLRAFFAHSAVERLALPTNLDRKERKDSELATSFVPSHAYICRVCSLKSGLHPSISSLTVISSGIPVAAAVGTAGFLRRS